MHWKCVQGDQEHGVMVNTGSSEHGLLTWGGPLGQLLSPPYVGKQRGHFAPETQTMRTPPSMERHSY